MRAIRSRPILVAIGGYIAASLAIPFVGALLGLALAILAAVLIAVAGVAKAELDPGRLSLAMLPLYYGSLGIIWSLPAMPGVILALPFIVLGEIRGVRNVAYYGLVGGLAAAAGRVVVAYYLGHWEQLRQSAGTMLIPATLFGLITGAIYWRFVGRNARRHTASSA